MEQIELPIISPRAELAGITAAISGLERIDALMQRIEGRSKLSIKVDVSGAEGIRNVAEAYDELLTTLRSLGKGGLADKLERDLISPTEAIGQMRDASKKLQKQWIETNAEIGKAHRVLDKAEAAGKPFGSDTATWQNDLKSKRDALNAFKGKQRELLHQSVQMEKSAALANALPFTYSQSRKSVNTAAAAEAGKLAGEETKLAEASGMSKDALAAQAMVVAEKTKLMAALAGSVAKVTKEEKELAAASVDSKKKVAAAAPTGSALLSTRTVKAEDGDPLTTSKYRGGAGTSRTYRPDGTVVEDRSVMADYKEQQRVIDADYKQKAAALSAAGYGKGTAQRNAELAAKRKKLEDLAETMNAAGLDSTSPRSAAGAIGMQLGDANVSERNKGEAFVRKQDEQARAAAEKQRIASEKRTVQEQAAAEKQRIAGEKRTVQEQAAAEKQRIAGEKRTVQEQAAAEKQRIAGEKQAQNAASAAAKEDYARRVSGFKGEKDEIEMRRAQRNQELSASGSGKGSLARRNSLAQAGEEYSQLAAKMEADGMDATRLHTKAAAIKAQVSDEGGADRSRILQKTSKSLLAKRQEEIRREALRIEAEHVRAEAELSAGGFGPKSKERIDLASAKSQRFYDLAGKAGSYGLDDNALRKVADGTHRNMTDAQMAQQEQQRKKAEQDAKVAAVAAEKARKDAAAAAKKAREDAEKVQREAEEQQRAADNRAQFGALPGDAKVRQRTSMSGSTTTTSTKGGKKHTETTDAAGNVTASSIADVGGLEKAHKSLGAQFVANTAKVALWTGSVGLLYGALGAIKSGFTEAFSLDRKFATLQAVFKGTEQEARGLMNTTLAMGAAHGRAASEAVEAVTEWSRAQLSAAEAGEALRVSLVAANVAEISSAEAGKNLAAIYQTNSLRITELSGVLGMMNAVSNTAKTTTKDLLDGFAQVGPLAAEAGISIAQTNAILGTTVAATARSGAQIGNTFKAMIVSLSDPRIQDYLRGRFNIESRTQDGGIKSGQEQMDDLFVASRSMNRAERGEMLVNVAGKHQASKVEAILENYPEAARKAIESQLSLNSAQVEQNKILDTTASKWETLKTQWATAFDALHQNLTKKPINATLETAGGIAKGAGSYIEMLGSPDESSGDESTLKKVINFHTSPFRSIWEKFTPSYWKGVGERRDKLRRDDALNYEDKNVQGDIENINQSKSRADAMKGTQSFIINTLRTRSGSRPEQYAKDVKQLGMTLEKNPEKQAALIKALVESQGSERKTEELLGPYFRKASKLEANSLLGEQAQKQFALDKADKLEAEMRTSPDFQGTDARAKSNRQRQQAQIELYRKAGAAEGRTSWKEDEAGRMANLLVTPAQETAAALEASKSKRGLLGEGFSYRIKAMSEISEVGARVNALKGLAGSDPGLYAKAKEDLIGARARLRVSDRDDMNVRAARNIEEGIARMGGGTDALAGSHRADFFESKRAEAVGGGVFGNRQKEVELIAAATGAMREQHDIGMAIAKTEADIVSARERQNIEAGKALQMASREDQARSALLKGFTERNGKLSPEQFQFLSSDFRQSALRLNPDSVPSALTGAGEAEQSLAMMRETATKLDAVVAALTPLGQAAQFLENARDAQLNVEMNINANDSVAELMRGFSELATAKLDQVFQQYGAEVAASIKRMEGAGKAGGAGVPVLFGE